LTEYESLNAFPFSVSHCIISYVQRSDSLIYL